MDGSWNGCLVFSCVILLVECPVFGGQTAIGSLCRNRTANNNQKQEYFFKHIRHVDQFMIATFSLVG